VRLAHVGIILIGALVGTGLSAVILKHVPTPYGWIFFLWFILLVACFRIVSETNLRAFCVNVAAVMVCGGLAEFYLAYANASKAEPKSEEEGYRMEGTITQRYTNESHPVLGRAPYPDVSVTARKYYGEELVYDVVYTIDEHGLRIAPPTGSGEILGCLLFFGGSFTIGEGVHDYESMPYRVGELTNGSYRVYNFGFHGYGPHQMLAAFEAGLVDSAIECEPDYVIYQALDRHVLRSAGVAGWGSNGPRFVAQSDGGVVLGGTFEQAPVRNQLGHAFQRQLTKSNIYGKVVGHSQARLLDSDDFLTFGAIVGQARKHVQRMNPDAQFHVVLWNLDSSLSPHVAAEFTSRAITYHPVLGNILPDGNYREHFALGPFDHHPNSRAYDLIARYVVEEVLKYRYKSMD